MNIHIIILLLTLLPLSRCFATAPKTYDTHLFSLCSTPTWREYALENKKIRFNKEKWAWTESFILKSKKPFQFTTLTLEWKGKKIDTLAASLYQKKEREVLLPIQQNLISQGNWNAEKQQLIFTLNEKVVAVNKYHLMLSYPKRLEGQVKDGQFVVKNTTMKLINT
jgi:hypothetical protein